MPASARIGVVAALEEELAPLVRRHGLRRSKLGSAGRLALRPASWSGSARSLELEAVCTGVGSRNAASGLSAAWGERGLDGLICLGLAGALTPELAVGDLLCAERIRAVADGEPLYEDLSNNGEIEVPESRLRSLMNRAAGVQTGLLISTGQILPDATAKQALGAQHAAPGNIAAVDLESFAWASWALQAQVPFIVVRAISDAVDEDLPLDFQAAIDDDGRLSRWKVLGATLRSPSAVPGLWRLRGKVKSCADRLEQAVAEVIGAIS